MSTGNPIYSILYLDGKAKNLDDFESAFRDEYHIFQAKSGREGLKIMEQRTIQLVITAQKLSDCPGLSFLEEIMMLYPDCTRIIQTGNGEIKDILEAASRGIVYQYVAFPWDRDALKVTIDGALELYYLKIHVKNQDTYLEEVKQSLQRTVMERTQQLEQQGQNITDSIHYASRIQKALMLSSEKLVKLLPSHFVLHKPKDIVSGDFYWASKKNDRLFLAVADCTGHGVPGAFMSIMGINFLNEIVNDFENPQTGEILDKLRKRLIRALGQTGKIDEAREGMDIALCSIDFDQNRIQFSGAFRPMYLIREGELQEIKGDRMPIGIYGEENPSFSNKELSFRKNDLIYLCSDGFVDQIGGLQRKTFKSLRFKKLLLEICHRPLNEQKAILREEHEIWRAGQEQIDDIMVVGVQLSGNQNKL